MQTPLRGAPEFSSRAALEPVHVVLVDTRSNSGGSDASKHRSWFALSWQMNALAVKASASARRDERRRRFASVDVSSRGSFLPLS